MRLEDLYAREIARERLVRIRRARARMFALNALGICSVCFAVCAVISIVIGSCTSDLRYAAARARGAAEADACHLASALSTQHSALCTESEVR